MRKQDMLLLLIAVSGEMPADLAEQIIGSVSYTASVITRLKQEGYISVRNKAGWKGYVLRAKGKRYVLSQYGEDTAFFLQGSVETNHVKTEIEKRLRLYRMSKVWVFFWKTGIPIFRSQKPEPEYDEYCPHRSLSGNMLLPFGYALLKTHKHLSFDLKSDTKHLQETAYRFHAPKQHSHIEKDIF